MPIPVKCQVCGFGGAVPDAYAGKTVKCRQCGTGFAVAATNQSMVAVRSPTAVQPRPGPSNGTIVPKAELVQDPPPITIPPPLGLHHGRSEPTAESGNAGPVRLWLVPTAMLSAVLIVGLAAFVVFALRQRSSAPVDASDNPVTATRTEIASAPPSVNEQPATSVQPSQDPPPKPTRPELSPVHQAALDQFDRGLTALKGNKPDDAIIAFTEAVRLAPSFGPAYRCRGQCYQAKGDVRTARADYTKALELDADDGLALLMRAGLNLADRQFAEAIRDCDQLLKAQPDAARALDMRGDARLEQAEFEGAVEDYTQVIRQDPQSAVAYRKRAYAYLLLGNQASRLDPPAAPDA
ncbi:MAG: tetratricopeptide repeat protein [Gemmataceae bacterium]|nr:tetratricopeptide repeat protein [Gemmataceae bacterium]